MAERHLGILAPDLTHSHGWGHYSLSLIYALQRLGVRMTIVSARDCPYLADVEVKRLLPSVSPLARAFVYKLAAALPAVRHELTACTHVHAHAEPYAPLATWSAGNRLRYVTAHGTYVRMGGWPFPFGMLYRRAFEGSHMICVSRYTQEIARTVLPSAQTRVINNGIDAVRFSQITPMTTQPHVLSVGAVKARKGMLELVQAMALVIAHIPNASCMIIGGLAAEPAYVARVEGEIERLGLGAQVRLAGRVDDATLLQAYADARVFALPSQNTSDQFEGYGLSLMEASAAGLPVIGSLGCGAEDAVDDGVTGLLVPQQDVRGLADAIVRLLSDAALAHDMGAAGRSKAQTQTWDHVAQRYMEAFRNGDH
jgi:glycosyltransferase involved in cell wall biosynthesis